MEDATSLSQPFLGFPECAFQWALLFLLSLEHVFIVCGFGAVGFFGCCLLFVCLFLSSLIFVELKATVNISMNEVVLVHHVSMLLLLLLLLVMLQLLVNSLVAEKQTALILCKHCPAIAKTLMCYQCCFSHKSKTICAAVKKVNSIPTKPSNPLVLCCEGWSSCSFRNREIFFSILGRYWCSRRDCKDSCNCL